MLPEVLESRKLPIFGNSKRKYVSQSQGRGHGKIIGGSKNFSFVLVEAGLGRGGGGMRRGRELLGGL